LKPAQAGLVGNYIVLLAIFFSFQHIIEQFLAIYSTDVENFFDFSSGRAPSFPTTAGSRRRPRLGPSAAVRLSEIRISGQVKISENLVFNLHYFASLCTMLQCFEKYSYIVLKELFICISRSDLVTCVFPD
jgi:hypothetical protein